VSLLGPEQEFSAGAALLAAFLNTHR
jgi:hypothetical protein